MRRILTAGLLLALMGAGCATAPATTPAPVTPEPAPTTATTPEPATPSVAEPTPTPAPTPKVAPKPAPKPTTKTVTVQIKDNVYSPQIVAINAGDTVVWKNVGTSNHTVHSAGAGVLWDSGNLAPGASFSRKFTATGRYGYSCSIHAGMNGTVIVGEIAP